MKFWCLQISQKGNQILGRFLQKSVKNLVGFLGDLKTPKIHSEINWPLKTRKNLLLEDTIKVVRRIMVKMLIVESLRKDQENQQGPRRENQNLRLPLYRGLYLYPERLVPVV